MQWQKEKRMKLLILDNIIFNLQLQCKYLDYMRKMKKMSAETRFQVHCECQFRKIMWFCSNFTYNPWAETIDCLISLTATGLVVSSSMSVVMQYLFQFLIGSAQRQQQQLDAFNFHFHRRFLIWIDFHSLTQIVKYQLNYWIWNRSTLSV